MKKALFLSVVVAAVLIGSVNEASAQMKRKLDRKENRFDRREDVRDRKEDVRDRKEDIKDRREDIRDRREDVRDAKHKGGKRDRF